MVVLALQHVQLSCPRKVTLKHVSISVLWQT